MKVDYVGICATDIEEYNYGPTFISHGSPNPITGRMMPLITGHEITGTIVETGPDVTNVGAGDRVVLDTILNLRRLRPMHQRADQPVRLHGRGGLCAGRRTGRVYGLGRVGRRQASRPRQQ